MAGLIFLIAYLLGSIPFSLLLGRLAGHDIRREGSNNIGATNLWRVCGWKLGLPGFFLDFFKGLAAVTVVAGCLHSSQPPPYDGILAGVGAVLGHNFPIFLRFKGGKGVATSAGVVAGLMWLPFVCAIAVFIVTVWISRYISLGSMLASVALVVAVVMLVPEPFGGNLPLLILACLLCVMLLVRHRANVARILAGTENRFPPPKKNR